MVVEKKTKTYRFKIDLDLAYEVYKARVSNGALPKNADILDHPLRGKVVFDHHKQAMYTIQGVYRHWYGGWYLVVLLERNGSHCCVPFEDLGCFHPSILDQIEKARYRYHLIDDKNPN